MFAKKNPYNLCFPLNIDRLQIEYISIPYCVPEYKALVRGAIIKKNEKRGLIGCGSGAGTSS